MFRAMVESVIFPAVLVGGLFGAWGLDRLGWSEQLVVFTVVASAALLLLALQRLLPAVPDWRHWGPDAGTDLAHLLFNSVFTTVLGTGALAAGLYLGLALAGDVAHASLWPTTWPMIPQLALALVVSEFFAYWLHRISHLWAPLWRFHAMHHSSERLYLLSSSRSHPLHVVFTYVLQILPIALLGAPEQTLMMLSVFTPVHGLMQHANIRMRTSPFNLVFSTCDLHRWHHSVVPEEEHSNYGNNLVVWDHVFGTYLRPRDRFAPEAVGLKDIPQFPRTFLGQLASPFRGRLFEAPPDAS